MVEKDYIGDIAEIRAMMERSSKFLSLNGWAGIVAGIYALAATFIAYLFFEFNPNDVFYNFPSDKFTSIVILAVIVLGLALGTAIVLCYRQARKRGESLWNPTAKRLLRNMAVPLIAGGVVLLIMVSKGLIGLLAPVSLIFYGLALFGAGSFTFKEVRSLGLLQIVLGLVGCYFVEYGLWLWGLGFGVMHIAYGFYMHKKYKR